MRSAGRVSVALGRLDEIMPQRPISDFIRHHYRHFNAAALLDAAEGYQRHLEQGGKMLVCLAGAMSTAELGLSLAEMIRQDKVHAICCTGANLEEDLFNLVAHDHYERIPNYRELSPQDEQRLLDRQLNRVTDTCIPEEEAMRHLEHNLAQEWHAADRAGERWLPHEFFYKLIRSGRLEPSYQIDPQAQLAARRLREEPAAVRARLGGLDARQHLRRPLHRRQGEARRGHARRHRVHDRPRRLVPAGPRRRHSIGFFQIGGGIAGDFPICVVPMMEQDLRMGGIRSWGYFCQISDSTTSYGSYSGAVPNEKITWGKLSVDTPKFIIESDATIVAPLIFAYVLGQ